MVRPRHKLHVLQVGTNDDYDGFQGASFCFNDSRAQAGGLGARARRRFHPGGNEYLLCFESNARVCVWPGSQLCLATYWLPQFALEILAGQGWNLVALSEDGLL